MTFRGIFTCTLLIIVGLSLTRSSGVEDLSLDLENYVLEEDDNFIKILSREEKYSDFARSLLADDEAAGGCRLPRQEKDCRKPKKPKEEECREPRRPAPPPPPPSPPPPSPPPPSPPPPRASPPPPAPPSPPPPDPNLPPREDMCTYTPRRKILSGLRLIFPDGGLRPCTGYSAPSKEACCEACKSNLTCAGWMYSQPLDCRNMGDPNPRSVCYMMSEVTGSYDPIIDAAEYWSATAVY